MHGEQPTEEVMDNSNVEGSETVASSIASLRASGRPELNPSISASMAPLSLFFTAPAAFSHGCDMRTLGGWLISITEDRRRARFRMCVGSLWGRTLRLSDSSCPPSQ